MGQYTLSIIGRYLALSLVLVVIWLLFSGFLDNTTLLVFGLASVLLTVWLTSRAGLLDAEGVPTRIFPGVIGYMIWLLLEIGKANLQVTKQVLAPKLSPKMITVPTLQKSDLGKVIFANSVTLTPGTVSIDLEKDCLVIHALTEDLADVEGIEAMGHDVFCRFRRNSVRNGDDDLSCCGWTDTL